VKDGRLVHDGSGEGDLWTERDFGDGTLLVEWRWTGAPVLTDFPAPPDGKSPDPPRHEPGAGDGGIVAGGPAGAKVSLTSGSGGSGAVGADHQPSRRADAPVGDWNRMQISWRDELVSVTLNDHEVIRNAKVPRPASGGPIGLPASRGGIQFRTIGVKPE
jgi:hypothetical protein